ncbi:MAG: LL-diaminopimelate aminotransferase [Candidatus Omnitrophica bacterium]|nr:LL-diaminopimelate aminotransferase [Candidatus Omnitrophota bacterium]
MSANSRKAKRLIQLPPYLFVEIDKAKRRAKEEGKPIIDLGIGDPDQGTPQPIVDALSKAAQDSKYHHYALDAGLPQLRRGIAGWMQQRYGVELNPQTEILPLIGSKEGISHLAWALLNPGDAALVPDPGYPLYANTTILAGAEPIAVPLKIENAFLPELDKIPDKAWERSPLMYLNYPNNPTGAACELGLFEEVVDRARKYGTLIAQDAAYSEMCYDGYRAPSILQVPGAKETAIEFHSFSKTFNMTGWRLGWVCGNAEALAALGQMKSNVDSGIFEVVQLAGLEALALGESFIEQSCVAYARRRNCLVQGLRAQGWDAPNPKATFYVWVPVPKGLGSSAEVAKLLLDKADLVVTPGNGFGKFGEGYIRFALTVEETLLEKAVERLAGVEEIAQCFGERQVG